MDFKEKINELKKIIIVILFLNFLSISLYFFNTYGEFKKSEEHFNQKKELIFKSLINKYKLSLDEQFLMNDALAPERGDKIQEFTSLIQRKSNCVIQGVKLACADSTIYEMLQLKDY